MTNFVLAGCVAILRYAILPQHSEQVCTYGRLVPASERTHGSLSNIHRG